MSSSTQSRWPSDILNAAPDPSPNAEPPKPPPQHQPQRRDYVAWSKRETDALVRWLATDDNFAAMKRATAKMLPRLAEHLQKEVSGCHKTPKQCDHKIRNLKKVYKKMRQKLDGRKLKGVDGAPSDITQEIVDSFPYFFDFERFNTEENSQQALNVPRSASSSPKPPPVHVETKPISALRQRLDDTPELEDDDYDSPGSSTILKKHIPTITTTTTTTTTATTTATNSAPAKCPIDHKALQNTKKRPAPEDDSPLSQTDPARYRNIQPKEEPKSILPKGQNGSQQLPTPNGLQPLTEIEKNGGLPLIAPNTNNTISKDGQPPPACPFHKRSQNGSAQSHQPQATSPFSKSLSTSPVLSNRTHVQLPKIESLIHPGAQAQHSQPPPSQSTSTVESSQQIHQPPKTKRLRSSSFSASLSSVVGMPISMCPVVSGTGGAVGLVSGCPVQRGDLSLPISTIAAAVSSKAQQQQSNSQFSNRNTPPLNIFPTSPESFQHPILDSPLDFHDNLPGSPNGSERGQSVSTTASVPNEETMHNTLLSILKIMSDDPKSDDSSSASISPLASNGTAPPSTSSFSSSSASSIIPTEKDSAKEMALVLAQHIKSSLAKRDAANRQTLQLQQLQSQIEREMVRAELLYKNGQKDRADKIMDKIDELENELHDVYAKPGNEI